MPRGLNNWTFNDVVRFLKDNGFHHSYTKGSHYFYRRIIDKEIKQVCVPFHGSKSIHPKTVKGIISQSGIPTKEWIQK